MLDGIHEMPIGDSSDGRWPCFDQFLFRPMASGLVLVLVSILCELSTDLCEGAGILERPTNLCEGAGTRKRSTDLFEGAGALERFTDLCEGAATLE